MTNAKYKDKNETIQSKNRLEAIWIIYRTSPGNGPPRCKVIKNYKQKATTTKNKSKKKCRQI